MELFLAYAERYGFSYYYNYLNNFGTDVKLFINK